MHLYWFPETCIQEYTADLERPLYSDHFIVGLVILGWGLWVAEASDIFDGIRVTVVGEKERAR